MDKVLTSTELLDVIFEFTDKGTDACCTRVCKSWFETAISHLWSNVENLQKIFAILAPIVKEFQDDDTTKYIFSRTLTVNDWKRFYKYSSHVRKLILDNKTWKMDRVFYEVAIGRIHVDLFPKLVKLKITADSYFSEYSALFLHNNLKEVVARVNGEGYAASLKRLCLDICERAQNIKKFVINGDIEISLIESQLLKLIDGERNLAHIGLPLYSNTSTIMSALATLPKLRTIEFQYIDENGDSWGQGNRKDVLDFNPSLCKGAFQELLFLDMAIGLQDMNRFLSMKYAPTNIQTLYLRDMESNSNSSNILTVTSFAEILAETCPSLMNFTLEMVYESTATSVAFAETLTFSSLRPLLKLGNIIYFYIKHPLPIVISSEDLVKLACSWPKLRTLCLNPEPLIEVSPSVKLADFIILAEHFPFLETLELYLDALSVDFETLQSTSVRLEKLQSLYLGASPIKDPKSIALYIGRLCSSSCILRTNSDWNHQLKDFVDRGYLKRREVDTKLWEEVNTLLQVITKAIEMERKLTKGGSDSALEQHLEAKFTSL